MKIKITLNPTLPERMKQKQKENFETQLSNHYQLHCVVIELPLNNSLFPNCLGFIRNRNKLLPGNANTIQDF